MGSSWSQLSVRMARCLCLITFWAMITVLGGVFPPHVGAAEKKSIQGVVKSESGAPVKGVFVQAQNRTTKITTSVLTDRQGKYWFDELPNGDYSVLVAGVGFSSSTPKNINLAADKSPSLDFELKSRQISWTELAWTNYKELLPDRPGKAAALDTCGACHGFRWHSIHPKDLSGWRNTLNWMRTEWSYFLGPEGVPEGAEPRLSDDRLELIASYLASVFGPEADLPSYPNVKRPEYGDEALNIVYVDYPLPTPKAFPWTAAPDDKGYIWIPEYNTNQIARLNPDTGEFREYKVPYPKRAAIHSAVPSPDGTVWATEASTAFRIAQFDPKTEKFTEYPDPRSKGDRGKHTNLVDSKGRVWSTGGYTITMFDPATKKYSYYGDKPLDWGTYGIAADKEDNIWFTRLSEGTLGKIDSKTGKVKEWERPKGSGPRRIHIDANGYVWFAEYFTGKLVRLDPKTETFKEFPLPGPDSRPYAIGIDAGDNLWYYAWGRSEMGRLEPQTGRITQYPVPYIDPVMRNFYRDSKGRMWYGAPSANKVGYFYLR